MLKQLHFDNVNLQIDTLGGQVCTFEVNNNPVFHPISANSDGPQTGGLFPMVPIANRVKENAFLTEGRIVQLPKVDWDQEFFLHGDGWKKVWTVQSEQQNEITLTLESNISEDIHYQATLNFKITHSQLMVTLKAKNLSLHPFPFNIGLHPFFCSSNKSDLRIPHLGYWPEAEKHLPLPYKEHVPKQYNFKVSKLLDQGWINHCYKLCLSVTELINHDMGYKVEITHSSDYLTIYQPERSAPFVCIEPQCFPINAHNFMNVPSIAPGEEQQITMKINVKDI